MTERDPPEFWIVPEIGEETEDPDTGRTSGQPGAPGWLNRRRRVAVVVAGLTLLAAGVGLQLHRAQVAVHQTALDAQPVDQLPELPMPLQQQRLPWPSATGGCGSSALLPITSTAPLTAKTGIRITVGGNGLDQVDVDTSGVRSAAGLRLPAGTFVLNRQPLRTAASGSPPTTSYLETVNCHEPDEVFYQFTPGANPVRVDIGDGAPAAGLFPDGAGGMWTARPGPAADVSDGTLQVDLVRLDRPGLIRLPANLTPVAVRGSLLVAEYYPKQAVPAVRLVVYDLAAHRTVRDLGPAASLTETEGEVLWTAEPCPAAGACSLHSYDLTTAATSSRGYALPVEAAITGGVLSPDHRRLAFQLTRMSEDPHYAAAYAGPPSDLVVLDLGSGVIEPVSNLELPPTMSDPPVGLSFAPDSKWLIISVTGPDRPQLLLWRSGLDHPLASAARLPGPPPDSFPVPVQPGD